MRCVGRERAVKVVGAGVVDLSNYEVAGLRDVAAVGEGQNGEGVASGIGEKEASLCACCWCG